MSSLLAAFSVSANSMSALQTAISVSQGDVANASTAGYVQQTLDFSSLSLDPQNGLLGGVAAGVVESARQPYAEQAVRQQTESLGFASQSAASLAVIEPTFDISGKTGIPGALNQLFSSFSAWSVAPEDTAARQAVLSAAQSTAQAFQTASRQIAAASAGAVSQAQTTVGEINQLSATIAALNGARLKNGPEPSADAKLNDTLERLSKRVNYTALTAADGTVTVLAGGQIPLVSGDKASALSANAYFAPNPPVAGGSPPIHVLDASGRDITSLIGGGQIGALLQFGNVTLASLGGDGQQQGALNILAQGFADRVNQLLTAGQTAAGNSGAALFTYSAAGGSTVAESLAVDPSVTADTLGAVQTGPPAIANGVPLTLADLANSTQPPDGIAGATYTSYFGRLAADVGSKLAEAKGAVDVGTQLVAQAQSLRSSVSGISLDSEAAKLLEYQRGYEAMSRVFTVLNQLAAAALAMVPAA